MSQLNVIEILDIDEDRYLTDQQMETFQSDSVAQLQAIRG